ncbi:MAG: hypothetical protein JRN21_09485 [Nitrososphaerota archaeon]|nr:hypothetical protein [Nitrososphaerota archaeon]
MSNPNDNRKLLAVYRFEYSYDGVPSYSLATVCTDQSGVEDFLRDNRFFNPSVHTVFKVNTLGPNPKRVNTEIEYNKEDDSPDVVCPKCPAPLNSISIFPVDIDEMGNPTSDYSKRTKAAWMHGKCKTTFPIENVVRYYNENGKMERETPFPPEPSEGPQ